MVIADDRKTADSIRVYLGKDDCIVIIAHDGGAVLKAALSGLPESVVLDLLLPELARLDVCRAQSLAPVILLTVPATEQDNPTGLNPGTEDYATKALSPRELLDWVRAVLRRTAEESRDTARHSLRHSGLALDPASHTVTVLEKEVLLTRTEFRLLEVLMREPGRLFTRAQLMNKVLGYDYEGTDRTIDVHVLNLRRKIELDSKRPEYIRTVYGEGYKLGG